MDKERPSTRDVFRVGWDIVNPLSSNAYDNPAAYDWIVESFFKRSRLASDIVATTQRYLPAATNHYRIRVLDEGTGTGALAIAFAQQGYDVTAIDIAAGALASLESNAWEKDLSIATSLADFNQPLPYPNGSFDVITTLEANRYIKNLDIFLEEIHRMLKEKGIFVWPIFLTDVPLWKMRAGISQPTFSNALVRRLKKHGFTQVKRETVNSFTRNLRNGVPIYAIPTYLIARK
jgi:ubiquinone/menaquinone biosynthesis C-methylase UbiE